MYRPKFNMATIYCLVKQNETRLSYEAEYQKVPKDLGVKVFEEKILTPQL